MTCNNFFLFCHLYLIFLRHEFVEWWKSLNLFGELVYTQLLFLKGMSTFLFWSSAFCFNSQDSSQAVTSFFLVEARTRVIEPKVASPQSLVLETLSDYSKGYLDIAKQIQFLFTKTHKSAKHLEQTLVQTQLSVNISYSYLLLKSQN